jgi:hypothetical protein
MPYLFEPGNPGLVMYVRLPKSDLGGFVGFFHIRSGRDGSRKFDWGGPRYKFKIYKVTYKNKMTFNSVLAKR